MATTHSQLYTTHLQSEKWARTRRLVLLRANHRCEKCGEATARQVHHLTYEHLGDEPLEDLVAVCIPCHQAIHNPDGPRAQAEITHITPAVHRYVTALMARAGMAA